MNSAFIGFVMLLAGGLLGYSIRAVLFILKKNNLEHTVAERLLEAKQAAQKITTDAREKIDAEIVELRKKEGLIDIRSRELDERALLLEQKSAVIYEQEKVSNALLETRETALTELAGIDRDQAYALLIKDLEETYAADLNVRMYKLDHVLSDTLNDRAKHILVTSIQRLAVPTASELTTATISIPNDEIKGKIIGKEGRNIRAFERYSGVELLVDEMPGSIVVSSFDPVRRAIAAHALEALIKDGRIQPARIEEELEKSRTAIHDIIKERGSTAVYSLGIVNFDPRLIAILGRLHFRTSYGQNVLQHSIETAHLASMIASEVGADPYIAKAGALVHDIGKALDHEFDGTHVEIGIKVLQRFGADERVITAMKSHHDDYPHESLEAVIVQTADMISGSRPGARRDTAELHLKRLQELESLASRHDGVERAFAFQAGREIRIFVQPERVSDIEARTLARTIAHAIETELRYPGQIKVTIIRETRITDYAR